MILVDHLQPAAASPLWPWRTFCRLFDDRCDVEALHVFAESVPVHRRWFQPGHFPYYRLGPAARVMALRAGAGTTTNKAARALELQLLRRASGHCESCGRRFCHCITRVGL